MIQADPAASRMDWLNLTVAGACVLTGELATKEEIQAVRHQRQAAVAQRGMFTVPRFFASGQVAERLWASSSHSVA